jgi:hypothetical protein
VKSEGYGGLDAPAPRGRIEAGTVARVVLCLIALVVTIFFFQRSYDDAFITYRYARNLAVGNGFVYNVGERYFGLTCPLYGLILGVIGWIFGPAQIPPISGIISGISIGATAWAILRMAERHRARALGFLAGLLYLGSPHIHTFFGSEMLPQIAAIAWALDALDDRRYARATVLGCLAALLRPDGLALLPVILAVYIYRERRAPWQLAGLAIALLAPAALVTYLYFGHVLPLTVGTKMIQGAVGVKYVPGAIAFLRSALKEPGLKIAGPVVLLLAAGGLLALRSYRWLLPALAWVVLHQLGYVAIGAAFYPWYMFPALFGLALLAALGAYKLAELVPPRGRALALAPLVAIVAFACIKRDSAILTSPDIRRDRYITLGKYLHDHTRPDQSFAAQEIGWLGWYSDRPLMDMCGLVTHRDRSDFFAMFRQYKPDIVLADRHIGAQYAKWMTSQPWFAEHYKEQGEFRYGPWEPITLYVPSA